MFEKILFGCSILFHTKILRDYNLQLESWLMFFKKNLTNRFGQD